MGLARCRRCTIGARHSESDFASELSSEQPASACYFFGAGDENRTRVLSLGS